MSLVVDEHQFNLNDEVYSKIKYQKTKENAVVLSKQNPYACSNDIIELYKKEDKEKTSKKVEELFNNKLNGDFKVKIVIVDNINDGGKFRWVIGKS